MRAFWGKIEPSAGRPARRKLPRSRLALEGSAEIKNMRTKVANTIPGRKAKDAVSEKKIPATPMEIEKAEEGPTESPAPETRESPDDKKRKAEARKEFDAEVRGKLKYSRKR